ncbi:MAG: hypothetical protein Q9208_006770 [Pyrenodesmia sp. 3 TL-2023]
MSRRLFWGLIILSPIWAPNFIGLALLASFLVCTAFVVEVVVEIFYVSTFWIRPRSRDTKSISEDTPLLTAGGLPVTKPRRSAQPLSRYPAIDIRSISLTNYKNGVLVKDLPVRTVQFPVDDLSKTAVLSWRWDFDNERRSRNLAAAIKHAQSVGIEYVFADIVSIDQTLISVDLTQQVLAFSVLYKTIPVLAAYDNTLRNLKYAMYRPWIFSELRLFAQNPTRLTYVGHDRQGSCVPWSAFCMFLGHPAKSRWKETNFEQRIQECWQADYVRSALQVLEGTTSMAQIFDFQIILPAFAEAFTRAEKLSRNDYLMTVTLLTSVPHYGSSLEYMLHNDSFPALKYDNYKIETRNEVRKTPKGQYIYGIKSYAIFIGTQEVANFKDFKMTTSNITEPTVLDMLELSDTERHTYTSRERKRQRRASLHLPTAQGRPQIDVVAVRL